MKKASAWVTDLIDGTSRALSFRRAGAKPSAQSRSAESSRRSTGPDFRKRLAEVHRLEAEGVARFEIARRCGLAQDTVGMLLYMATARVETIAKAKTSAKEGIGAKPEIDAKAGMADRAEMAAWAETNAEADDPAESAVRGTFFRILQSRISANKDVVATA
jgi:DNA-binding CsgD family transcriptional regulator